MSEQHTQDDAITEQSADTKSCPICGETIKVGAKKCIHCDEFIDKDRLGFKRKTLWDIFGLLIIPLALAGMGFWFANFQDKRDIAREDRLRVTSVAATATQQEANKVATANQQEMNAVATSTREVENTVAADARATEVSSIEENRAQETALQTYFDQMADLLIDEKLRSEPRAEVRDVARTRTLTLLRRLDPERKGALLRFLHEAELITGTAIIELAGADLSEANLSGSLLNEANLFGANLVEAPLVMANLVGANLFETDLSRANLEGANLVGANLVRANLVAASLVGAKYNTEPYEDEFGLHQPTQWPDDFDPIAAGAIDVSKTRQQ
jgi:predicted nucleic acid-binding Zn ribbon protein